MNPHDNDSQDSKMAKHTPGPWRVEECGSPDCWCRIVVAAVPDVEDDFTIISSGSLRAHNAALVAAAPDLLSALERLSAQAARARLPGQSASDAEKAAVAAIAKATGAAA